MNKIKLIKNTKVSRSFHFFFSRNNFNQITLITWKFVIFYCLKSCNFSHINRIAIEMQKYIFILSIESVSADTLCFQIEIVHMWWKAPIHRRKKFKHSNDLLTNKKEQILFISMQNENTFKWNQMCELMHILYRFT